MSKKALYFVISFAVYMIFFIASYFLFVQLLNYKMDFIFVLICALIAYIGNRMIMREVVKKL